MPQRQQLSPDWPWAASHRIAQGVQVGDTVYTSGQIAMDPAGNLVGEGDLGAQARQVFANIRAILAEAGATMGRRRENYRFHYRYESIRRLFCRPRRGFPQQCSSQFHGFLPAAGESGVAGGGRSSSRHRLGILGPGVDDFGDGG